MVKQLSEDSLATLLICSGLTSNGLSGVKSYSLTEWNKLAALLANSEIKTPKGLFHTNPEDWKRQMNLSDTESERLQALLDCGGNLAMEIERLSSMGIWITTRAEETYPTLLKRRLSHRCPAYLFCAGNSDLLYEKGIAVIGSRNVDQEGVFFTEKLVRRVVKEGYAVVSGGAKGVDKVAERTAIEARGRAISIVIDGFEKKISHKEARQAISGNQLLEISPVHPKMSFNAGNAMGRNKYIYALSRFAVAISSDYNKGGTWAGAKENINSRWVPLFVRKEENIPQGNRELIKLGAVPLEKEVLEKSEGSLVAWMESKEQRYFPPKEESVSLFGTVTLSSVQESKKELNLDKIDDKDININNEKMEVIGEERKVGSAYEILKENLLEALTQPQTVDELKLKFDVRKGQMLDWLELLQEEGLVEKNLRPVRFIRKEQCKSTS